MQYQQQPSVKSATGLSVAALFLLVLAACDSGESSAPVTSESPDARALAASATAQNNANCQIINPFYWEIGDATGVIVTGSTGDGSIARTTSHSIASSTKWLFGAYVAEKRNGALDATDLGYLTMSSGYTGLGALSCSVLGESATVQNCFDFLDNETYTAAHAGKFFYNGGHFQKWAVANGMGAMTSADLMNEFRNMLGTDVVHSFGSPQLAGGAQASAESYARFLVRVLKNELRISALLGTNAVCTLPTACTTAVSSPIPEEVSYSIGHWVENDPTTGDGSFSSAGLFGFYPWIDASKTYYGIISRHEMPGNGSSEIGAGWESMQCGRLIRKAFLTGQAQ